MRYKNRVRTILIFVIIVGGIVFFYSNISQPPFIHITEGKDLDIHRIDSTYYSESILVAHPPKDTLERMKMMINYHDTTGLSLADLKKQMHVKCNDNETYIGSICIARMEESPDKWKIVINYNLGTEPDADYIGTKSKDYILYDERDSNFYEKYKDDEIVRYYHELQERKRCTKKSK